MGLYGSIVDISETRRVEQSLEKNLLTYNLIVDNLTDGLVEIDSSLNVSFVNRNAKSLLQKDKELFVHAMPLNELIRTWTKPVCIFAGDSQPSGLLQIC